MKTIDRMNGLRVPETFNECTGIPCNECAYDSPLQMICTHRTVLKYLH